MALKGDRQVDAYDISFFMNMTGERGGIVVHSTTGSGAAMDQGAAVVALPTGGAGGTTPAGLLLNDVVQYDLTRQHLNEFKDEVQVGSKVTLMRRGWVVTDRIVGGQTPVAGNTAWYDTNGFFRTSDPGSGTKVGRFLSGKDENGFAKVEINITG
jgi:hypothetical protein